MAYAFSPSSPIIWKNTGVQLYSNVQHIDVTFQYISVCSVLELGHTPEEHR